MADLAAFRVRRNGAKLGERGAGAQGAGKNESQEPGHRPSVQKMARGCGVTFPPMAKAKGRSVAFGALLARALAAEEQGQALQAEMLYLHVLEQSPEHPAAHNLLGALKLEQGEATEALAHFERALRGEPDNPDLLHNRGAALRELGRHEEAAASLRSALTLSPHDAETLSDLGMSLRALDREEEALECFDRALRRKPDFAQALTNRGNALLALGRQEEAIASHRSALALDERNADVRLNLAVAELAAGDWLNGWRHYGWRRGAKQFAGRYRTHAQPLWQGEAAISGRTILLHAEQGFGDTIMFARYAPLVAARGARVVLEVQPRLKRLLEQLGGVAQVVATGEALAAYDLQCPLAGLPLAFGTTPETVPAAKPYLVAPDDSAGKWRQKLAALRRPLIGIAWSGSAAYGKDRTRSISLEELGPLLAAPGAGFVSLQKEVSPEDRAALETLGIPNTGPEQEDFCDAAGLIAQLDLVISVDTAVAHLAGAMGKRVWLLLSSSPDWRWMREREDTPWYPSTRLFRQRQRASGWNETVARLVNELVANP